MTLWFVVVVVVACDVLILLGIVGLRLNYHMCSLLAFRSSKERLEQDYKYSWRSPLLSTS